MYAQAGIPERLKSADGAQLPSAPKKSDRPSPTCDSILEPQRSPNPSRSAMGEQRRIKSAFQFGEDGQAQEGTESWQTQGEILPVDYGIGRDSENCMGTRRSSLRALRALRQHEPTWSRYSIKKRAATLGLCRRRAPRWTDADENHLLWSIDSNASLALIAERLGRTVAAVRKKLRDLDYTAESLGGFKVKDVADMFAVPPARVQYWVAEKLLLTKGGRITDSSVSKFLAEQPEKVVWRPEPGHANWLREMGYPDHGGEPKANMAGRE